MEKLNYPNLIHINQILMLNYNLYLKLMNKLILIRVFYPLKLILNIIKLMSKNINNNNKLLQVVLKLT